MNCYHAHVSNGEVYGVAADTVADARTIVHARLQADGADAPVAKIEPVGTCNWDHGTTIHY